MNKNNLSKESMNIHFYIDYCPYDQAIRTLQAIEYDRFTTIQKINEFVRDSYRSEVRKRLELLSLIEEVNEGQEKLFRLTSLGRKVKDISFFDPEMLPDTIHFLHSSFNPTQPASPKMFWSYLNCSKILWDSGYLRNYKEIAEIIQNKMKEDFPGLDFTASKGARFDHYAVGRWANFVKNLIPLPIDEVNNKLLKRNVNRYELILLAIDYIYRMRKYRYGDPVILSNDLINEVSSIFFLDSGRTRQLIQMASKISGALTKRDTNAGMAIVLREPYGIEQI